MPSSREQQKTCVGEKERRGAYESLCVCHALVLVAHTETVAMCALAGNLCVEDVAQGGEALGPRRPALNGALCVRHRGGLGGSSQGVSERDGSPPHVRVCIKGKR